jgi:hypothetical protein
MQGVVSTDWTTRPCPRRDSNPLPHSTQECALSNELRGRLDIELASLGSVGGGAVTSKPPPHYPGPTPTRGTASGSSARYASATADSSLTSSPFLSEIEGTWTNGVKDESEAPGVTLTNCDTPKNPGSGTARRHQSRSQVPWECGASASALPSP